MRSLTPSEQDWRVDTANFYESLYECVWQNLEALLGTAAALDLLAFSSNAIARTLSLSAATGLVVKRAEVRQPAECDCAGTP